MNKSKFLKKSLAAILSVLLVVAMIPLSAAAVFEPIIWVNDLETDHTAGSSSYSVTKSLDDVTSVKITSNMLPSEGRLFAVVGEGVDKEEVELVTATPVDLTKFAAKNGDTYTLTIENRSDENDKDGVLEVVATYTLTITNAQTPIDKETGITKVVHSALYDPASYTIEGNTITMILPFGAAQPNDLATDTAEKFVPASKDATVVFKADAVNGAKDKAVGKIGEVVVSVTGGTKKYDVKVAYKDLFSSLTIEDEVEHELTSVWADPVTNAAVNELTVTMPYGTATKTIVPTFTLGDSIKRIEYTNNTTDTRTLTSGATLPVYTGASPSDAAGTANGNTDSSTATTGIFRDLKVIRDDNTEITVKLTVKDQTNNPEAKLTSIQLTGIDKSGDTPAGPNESGMKSNVVEFGDATSVTVEMPAGFVGPTADIDFVVSKGAKVQIVEQSKVVDDADDTTTNGATKNDGKVGLSAVDVINAQKNKRIEIQVTSADGNTTSRYYVTITVAEKDEAFLNAFTLKDDTTKESYTINKWTTNDDGSYSGTLSVPYSYKLTANLNALKVYAVTSVGAEFTTPASGVTNGTNLETWNAGTAVTPSTVFVDNPSPTGLTIVVENDNSSPTQTNTYHIFFKAQAAKTAHGLRGLTLTAEDTYSQVTADNTYSTTIGTLPTKANDKVSVDTVKVNVPYSFDETSITEVYAYELKVDDGAVVLNNDPAELKAFDPEKYGDQSTDIDSIDTAAAWFTSVADGKIDTTTATLVYVVSEKAWVDKNATASAVKSDITNLVAAKLASVYYVYGEKAKAETGSEILSIESTLDPNVTATLDKSSNTINITVPASYNNAAGTAFTACKKFTLNFTASKLATLDTILDLSANRSTNLVSDLGSSETPNPTNFIVKDNAFYFDSGTVASDGTIDTTLDWRGPVYGAAPYNPSTGAAGTVPLFVTAEDGVTTSNYTIKFTVDPVQEGAELTQVKVGNSTAAPVGTIVNLTVPVGTVLNPQKLELTASKMASIKVNGSAYSASTNYDLSTDVTIEVTSESGDNVNTYILRTSIATGFQDVPAGVWYEDDVNTAAAEGWIKGVSDNIFDPYNTMTRAQFALIIARIDGGEDFDETTEIEDCPFPDVEGTAYRAAAKYVYDNNIMQGDGQGMFNPNAAITRQEAAIVLCKFKGIEPVSGGTDYVDNGKIATWAVDYVKAATEAGIFNGDTANAFNPATALKRCEGAAILVRATGK